MLVAWNGLVTSLAIVTSDEQVTQSNFSDRVRRRWQTAHMSDERWPADGADGVDAPRPTDDLAEALLRVGDRWSLQVVDALRAGARRYGELESVVRGIAPNVLSKRLRDLEAEGLVVASPYQRRPVRMTYELTEVGRDLAGALDLLRHWGSSLRGGEPMHHDACGTEVELRLWCPTCERVVTDLDAEGLHHL